MKKSLSILMLVLFSIGTIQAQSADEIVQKYIKAIGGAAKQKALKNRKVTLTLHQNGAQIPGAIIADAKNRQRFELSFQGMKMVQAYDGTTAWGFNQFAGINNPTKLEGEEAKGLTEEQFLDSFIDYKKNGASLVYEGEEDFTGSSCHKIKMTNASGTVTTHYFDKESGLQKGQSQMSAGQSVVSEYDDYKETDGIMIPMKLTQKVAGQVLVFIMSKIEHNVELTDAIFAFPGN